MQQPDLRTTPFDSHEASRELDRRRGLLHRARLARHEFAVRAGEPLRQRAGLTSADGRFFDLSEWHDLHEGVRQESLVSPRQLLRRERRLRSFDAQL